MVGNGVKIDLRDVNHLNLVVNVTTLGTLATALIWCATQWNEWKHHKEVDWTTPEMVSYAVRISENTKTPFVDPQEIHSKFVQK